MPVQGLVFKTSARHFVSRVGSTPTGFRQASYHENMSWTERIEVNPEIAAGKPVIKGTRLAVEFILELLAAGEPEESLLENYPGITREDLLACLSYAAYLVHEFRALPIPA